MISIIMPVYNALFSLKGCLESISLQTYKYFEVWIIDDGSTDGSSLICDEFCCKDQRFNVLHTSNAGVSNARNLGLKKAKSEWICFIDADDVVTIDYLEKISINFKTDLIVTGYRVCDSSESYYISLDEQNISIKYQIELLSNSRLLRTVWGKVLRRNIIIGNNIYFNSAFRLGEDTLFMLEYLCYVNEITFCNSTNYIYTKPSFSINKYRVTADEYLLLYEELQNKTVKLEITRNLNLSGLKMKHYNSIGWSYICLLYLSRKYNYIKREKYYKKMMVNSFPYLGLGLSGMSRFIYLQLSKTKLFRLIDVYLMFYLRIIQFKNIVYDYVKK